MTIMHVVLIIMLVIVQDVLVLDHCVCAIAPMLSVCMYKCMYVCMYVRTYVRMHVRMHVRTYICMYVSNYVCMHISCMCMHICMHIRKANKCISHCLYFRNCYFTMAAAHKKNEFVTQLSASYGSGGLMCSFNDKELTQYVEWKRRIFNSTEREEKKGVLTIGKQPCGKLWVLAEDCCIDNNGELCIDYIYVWLKKLVTYGHAHKELMLEDLKCSISKPLSTENLKPLLQSLEICLGHNFLSCVLLMGAGVMAFHYKTIIDTLRFCPQIMAVGPPSTGKTLSLQATLALFGADNCSNQYNTCTKAYCLQRSAVSTVPFGIDDPSFSGDINDIIVSFFNGTMSANIAQGGLQPISCPIFCTNFSVGSNERYNIHMYVCMYIRMYVCMYVCIYVCTCMNVCMYVCMYICMYVWVYTGYMLLRRRLKINLQRFFNELMVRRFKILVFHYYKLLEIAFKW